MEIIKYYLVALYLRGLPRPAEPPRRAWPLVVGALRRSCSLASLREAGLTLEALLLTDPERVAEGQRLVESGSVVTACCAAYPTRWLSVLGAGAPPALWCAGKLPDLSQAVGIVGSRQVEPRVLRFCQAAAACCAEAGYAVISGGATGCDAAAFGGAGDNGVEIWAHGLRQRPSRGATLTLAAPNEPFSTALAMERNSLIYAAGRGALVGHSRFKQGGAWHGAASALRRRLAPVYVRADGSAASRALCGLGALPVETPEAFLECLEEQIEPLQSSLSFAV